jgi:hypothetical protein
MLPKAILRSIVSLIRSIASLRLVNLPEQRAVVSESRHALPQRLLLLNLFFLIKALFLASASSLLPYQDL